MNDDQKVSFISKVIFEVIFIITSIIYDLKLYKLNNEINSKGLKNPFEIVSFKNNLAISYFIYAILLIMIAIILVVWFFNTNSNENSNIYFLILFVVTIIINSLIIISIFKLINNPILRAILIVGSVGFTALVTSGNN